MGKKTKLEERRERTNALIDKVRKKFGDAAVTKFDGKNSNIKVEGFTSGSFGLDVISGCGGFPRGRITELFGKPSSGKTTLALHAIAAVQRSGGDAAFIDREQSLDPRWARTLGVDMSSLLVSQPDYGEEALEILQMLIESNGIQLAVLDSVAGLTPRAEQESDIGDAIVGGRARMISQAIDRQLGILRRTDVAMIYLNQVRAIIGGPQYGPKTHTPGGWALQHHCGMRVEVTRIQTLKGGDRAVGQRTRCKVVKNKVGGFPYAEAEFDLMFGEGVSQEAELLDYGKKFKVLEVSGASYAFKGERLGYGREEARQFLRKQPKMAQEIRELLYPLVEGSVPSEIAGGTDKPNEEKTIDGGKTGKEGKDSEEE
jgi:recombination protein RecA